MFFDVDTPFLRKKILVVFFWTAHPRFSPCHFRPLLGPREGKGEAATLNFVPLFWGTLLILRPFVGDLRECNFCLPLYLRFFYSHALLRGPLSWG